MLCPAVTVRLTLLQYCSWCDVLLESCAIAATVFLLCQVIVCCSDYLFAVLTTCYCCCCCELQQSSTISSAVNMFRKDGCVLGSRVCLSVSVSVVCLCVSLPLSLSLCPYLFDYICVSVCVVAQHEPI